MPEADKIHGGTLGSTGIYTCKHCHQQFEMKWGTFINHERWCGKNPKRVLILKQTKENVSKGLKKFYDKKLGEKTEYIMTCEQCGKQFTVIERPNKHPEREHYFCCQTCANTYVSNTYVDKKNISEGFRNKSEAYKEYYRNRFGREWDPQKSFMSKFEQPQVRYCEYCGKEFSTTKPKQKFCCQECGSRNRYINSIKHLLPLTNNDPQKLKAIETAYKHSCQFTFGISTYPDEFDIDLLRRVGWYKAKNHGNNLNGVSRDHKFSCKEGFRELIDPYIISHPANCKLLQHSINASKFDKCSITIDELIDNIHKWNDKYGIYENKIDYIKFDKLGIKFNIMYS